MLVPLSILGLALFFAALADAKRKRRRARRRSSPPRSFDASQTPSRTEAACRRLDAKTAHPAPKARSIAGAAWVVDGDTIVVEGIQIRLFGVDAPEMDHPFGRKAKWALVSLCKGQRIRAEVTDEDAYGRTVARCFLADGRDLSAEMVKLGLAIDWPTFSGGIYRSLEPLDARRKLWLADARQKGRLHVWEKFEAQQGGRPRRG